MNRKGGALGNTFQRLIGQNPNVAPRTFKARSGSVRNSVYKLGCVDEKGTLTKILNQSPLNTPKSQWASLCPSGTTAEVTGMSTDTESTELVNNVSNSASDPGPINHALNTRASILSNEMRLSKMSNLSNNNRAKRKLLINNRKKAWSNAHAGIQVNNWK
jgi:hypothetical protein